MKHHAERIKLLNMTMVEDGDRVLVEDRVKHDWPGITFPGGHVEANESIFMSAKREFKEETGLVIDQVQCVGLCQYQDQDDDGEFRRIIYFFTAHPAGGSLKSSREGKVFWIKRNELENYELAGSLVDFLEIFRNPDKFELIYTKDSLGKWQKSYY